MSIRISSGCPSRAKVSPTSAVAAASTVWPSDSRRNVASFMFAALSSTSRMVATSVTPRAEHRPADLVGEPLTIEAGFPHDGRHVAVESRPLIRADRGCRDDHDRDASGRWRLAQRFHDLEAVHVGHHQIEDDEIGQLALCDVDPLASAVGAQNDARDILKSNRYELDGRGVVVND